MASTSTSDATFVGRQFQKEMSDCPRWNGIEETKTQQVDDDRFHFFLPSMRQMQLVCAMNTSKMVKKMVKLTTFCSSEVRATTFFQPARSLSTRGTRKVWH